MRICGCVFCTCTSLGCACCVCVCIYVWVCVGICVYSYQFKVCVGVSCVQVPVWSSVCMSFLTTKVDSFDGVVVINTGHTDLLSIMSKTGIWWLKINAKYGRNTESQPKDNLMPDHNSTLNWYIYPLWSNERKTYYACIVAKSIGCYSK